MDDMVAKGRSNSKQQCTFPKGHTIWVGKKHTQETKDKIAKANSKHQKGKGNSQYGTCWIYNLSYEENMKIPRFELPEWKKKGWVQGRKMKF